MFEWWKKRKEKRKKNKEESKRKLETINKVLEKSDLKELAFALGDRKEVFKRNLLAGVSRGIGTAIGFTILAGIIIYALQYIVKLNIPIIGDYIADLILIVQANTK